LNTDQAFQLLQEAGITDSVSTFRKWLREGKIKATGFNVDEQTLYKFIQEYKNPNKDEIITQLKAKIKAKESHIIGVENLHESAAKTFSKQRERLTEEILQLKKENIQLQKEAMELLKENIELRNKVIQLKEQLLTGNTGNTSNHASPSLQEYQKKLGLSKQANHKEVLTAYKELLLKSHPDHGGNTKVFQYIKYDYDQLRKNSKN
jgi:hypothetical protein